MSAKMIYLARRNPALTAAQFPQAWREHSALGAGCTNVRDKVLSVTQCSRVLDAPALPGTTTDYDGVNLLRLRDRDCASAIWSDPETLAIMRPDEPRVFSTYVREFTLVCEETVLRDLPRGACCLFGFLRSAAPGLGLEGIGPDLLDRPGARRLVWNAVCEAPPPGYDYAAIAEWWFDDVDAAGRALAGADPRVGLAPALAARIDAARSVFVLTQVTHSRP
ncbi:MAG: EthD domain-containing protein [Burkholderiales bacterium]|nr:EthD domain-containing protein [Burkholderiales bacterium]MDE1926218.1 EthD domain-containing protein [Burkholderiales bacterium]MDE2157846.1 EthD domain-containing protein [Burkholderiales bacterium]MDE2502830.1 EthD domain-containing protein [Burkholderiales bacterium]